MSEIMVDTVREKKLDRDLTVNGYKLEKEFKFSGGELQVRLPVELEGGASSFSIVSDLANSDDIMRVLLVANAITEGKWINSTLPEIELCIPYFPYARQDRVCHSREAFSKSMICGLFHESGIRRVRCLDIHSHEGTEGIELLSGYVPLGSERIEDCDYDVIIAPDKGAKDRADFYANDMILGEDALEVVYLEKARSSDDGRILPLELTDEIINSIKGKRCLMVDDICDGGFTFVNIANAISKHTESLDLFVTHGIFSKGADGLFASGVRKIITTNSFPSPTVPLASNNFTIIDVVT